MLHMRSSHPARVSNSHIEVLRQKDRYHTKSVYRQGDVVHKEASPWTATVHSLLRHLEAVGFAAAPKVLGTGFDPAGDETLAYIPGDSLDSRILTEASAFDLGALLARLHGATASYRSPDAPTWRPWCGRTLGSSPRIISHCDVAPWNIILRNDLPIALIDWDYAGPVDPLVDLAQACWLCANLHDDIVAEKESLPPMATRAKHLRAVVDGYGLPSYQRVGLVDLMVQLAIHSTAAEADEAGIMPDVHVRRLDGRVVWAMAWRSRAASWMLLNRKTLERAL